MKTLCSKAKMTGLKPQAYLISLINEIHPKELPPMDFFDVLKNLRQINVNMNQIAVKANSIGFIDTESYWKNVDELQKNISEIKRQLGNG